MKLAGIHAFGNEFDLAVTRVGDKLQVEALRGAAKISSQVIAEGQSVTVRLPD